ncbi:MAG: electron transport complex subunit RsxB [Burkholderiaceae bacterium]|nr:electron transport complex subunit RsxB [Burkholderiaceae bacterium]
MTAALTQESLVEAIDKALPQTQCTRCGFIDCRAYAQAVAAGEAHINQCPPGGNEGVQRLAALTGRPALPLNPVNGLEGPRQLAIIDEAWCIGCTLCIKACPVDCIVGAAKQMHVIVNEQCTGCELCIPACPVDCISLLPVTPGRSGWQAWSAGQAEQAQERYEFHQLRVERAKSDNAERLLAKAEAKLADVAAASRLTDADALEKKRAVIQAAIARAKAQRR